MFNTRDYVERAMVLYGLEPKLNYLACRIVPAFFEVDRLFHQNGQRGNFSLALAVFQEDNIALVRYNDKNELVEDVVYIQRERGSFRVFAKKHFNGQITIPIEVDGMKRVILYCPMVLRDRTWQWDNYRYLTKRGYIVFR